MKEQEINNLIDDYAKLHNKVASKETWSEAQQQLWLSLGRVENKSELEKAATNKNSWYLPIPYKFALLEVAKYFGCNSFEFWKDYYQYKATYMEPNDPQRPFYLERANGKYL